MSLSLCFYYILIFNFITNSVLVFVGCDQIMSHSIPGHQNPLCLLKSCGKGLTELTADEVYDNSSLILIFDWESKVSTNASNEESKTSVINTMGLKQKAVDQMQTSDINSSNQCPKYAMTVMSEF